MILVLGASGYVGRAFAGELRRRGCCFIPLSRQAIDYTNFELLFDYLRKIRPSFLINAAGCTGKPNADACELAREETLSANTLLPQTIARACLMTNTPWGHVSSASIYSGAKVLINGRMRVEKNLNRPELRQLLAEHPEKFFGFTEWDEPNFSFRCPPCNYYSGTKALAEEVIRGVGRSYIWRAGMPFNELEEPRNFLWRIQRYGKVYDSVNSISHLGDFVRACLDIWERRAPFGIYNVTNPGAVTTRQVVKMVQRILRPDRRFEFWKNDAEFYRHGAKAPRSGCILDGTKLLAGGVKMRPAKEALEDSLCNWRFAAQARELASRQAVPSFAESPLEVTKPRLRI
jgi:dTDP-4-dehydrorhamnose reductase